MVYDNVPKQLKFDVLERVAQLAFEGKLEQKLDQIPYDIIPGPTPNFRCCIYREREIIRERVTSACGKSLVGQEENAIVGVMPAACEGCPISRFTVTDNCQKCLSKKCQAACPFGAISVTGRSAYIDPAKCKECGRCASACPYNAIADTMRPCLRACPVNAIIMDDHKQAGIDYSRCISCGACTSSCPFGAITDRSWIVNVIEELKTEKEIYAVFAPSIEGQFGDATVGQLKAAIRKIGFAGVMEVSLGADATAYHEAQELKEVLAHGGKMTTSCCPAFVDMIEKNFPKLVPNISRTASPMTMTVRYIKAEHPNAKVVFIGPCIAKKLEAQKVADTADYVLTFEELAALFSAKKINVNDPAENEQDGSVYGKNFAKSGGVSAAVATVLDEENFSVPFTCHKCDGAKECKKVLMVMNAGRLQEDMVEGMACEGGCVAGPAGVETVQKIAKRRTALTAQADSRGITENLKERHTLPQINMEQRP